MKNLSRSILLSLAISILSLLSISANGQYYIRLQDASGFDTDPYQTTLNEAAHQLVLAFPDTFQSRFRVFSCGFYAEQEFYGNDFGYPQAFGRFREQAADNSDFYLLFGRQSDSKGIYTKFWVDLKLPETGNFSCLDFIERKALSKKLEIYIGEIKNANFDYAYCEKNTIDSLQQFVLYETSCCEPGKGLEGCSPCPDPTSISAFLKSLGFKAFPITLINNPTKNTNKQNNIIINESGISEIIVSGRTENIENNIYDMLSAIADSMSVSCYITTDLNFCDTVMIRAIQNNVLNLDKDVNIWFHLLKKNDNINTDLLLLLDRSKYNFEWSDLTLTGSTDKTNWFSPYHFAGDAPIIVKLDSLAPAKLGYFESLYNASTGVWVFNRALRFAESQGIPREDIYLYNINSSDLPDEWNLDKSGDRKFVLIYDYNTNGCTGECPYEHMHIFRDNRTNGGFACNYCAIAGDCCDDKWMTWDLFWDAEKGHPILTEKLVGSISGVMDVPFGPSEKVSKATKYLAKVAGSSGKTWVVYTFLTKTGRYYGITFRSFTKRLSEHAKEKGFIWNELKLFEGINDFGVARGLEQIMITSGRLRGILTDQNESIKLTRKLVLKERCEKAINFLSQFYPSKLNDPDIQASIAFLRNIYNN